MPDARSETSRFTGSTGSGERVPDVLEAIAGRQPLAPAMYVPGRPTLRYGALGTQLRAVRERLQGWEFEPGDVIAAAIAMRPEFAVAIATLSASCTLAPLDPSLPCEACVVLLTRLRAKAVLVARGEASGLRQAAQQLGLAELHLVPAPEGPAGLFTLVLGRRGDALTPARGGRSCDPSIAYVLTSSGTTGRRKLVPTRHATMLRFASATRDWLAFTPADVGVHITPLYFGLGLQSSLMLSLLTGRSMVCLPVADIEGVFASFERYAPTFLTAGFTSFRDILRRAPEFPSAIGHSRLRFMRSASGHLDSATADRLEQIFGAPMLISLSSTEAACVTHDPLPPRQRKRGAVGLPIGNEVALLTSAGEILPAGGPGEILVRGPLVFDGYLDDAELNAASFLGDWFRTGDVGRIDDDGYLHLDGRITDVINRGGEKISPVEIDHAIESLPGVREAAAFAVAHPSLGQEIVAAVVREPGALVDAKQVVERVRERVGAQRVPRQVCFVDCLPRTENGKLRRAVLPEWLADGRLGVVPRAVGEAADHAAPAPIEGKVAALWSALLDGRAVARDDDFFLLGGDSLRGAQLLSHVQRQFDVALPIAALFADASTVAGMARAIEGLRALPREVADDGVIDASPWAADPHRSHAFDPMTDDKPLPPPETSLEDRFAELGADQRALLLERLSQAHTRLGRADAAPVAPPPLRATPRGEGRLPLSFAQQRLWFLDRLLVDKSAYNIEATWRLRGRLDVAALQRSLQALVARHESLRTRFCLGDGEPVQEIDAPPEVPLPLTDLSDGAAAEREARALQIAHDHAQQPIDLARGPLLVARLLRLAADEHWLLINVHHIASDGWSVGVFDRELGAFYAALVHGREALLPPLPVQYADYAVWQRQWLSGDVLARQLAYWKRRLADLPVLALPTDRPRPALASHRGARWVQVLPLPVCAALKTLGVQQRATLFMTLLAAFQVLLGRYSGQRDIVVGSPIAGRNRHELEGLIGFFVNTLVLRANLSGRPRFLDLLAQVRETALAAYTHQDLPFEKLVEELAPARDTGRDPLFQVLFALQNAPTAPRLLEGLEVERLVLERGSAKFDLGVSVRETDAGLRMSWEYATDLFDAATVERMAGHYQRLLEAIVADPAQCIDELPLLSVAEHRQLAHWNDTAVEYPRDSTLSQCFEAQAALRPEAAALVCDEGTLSYAELNARANRLAHRLIELGVGPDMPVAICAERSVELVIGFLGILKAGGAYLPLDAGHPPARLAFLLQDTQAPLLLTHAALAGQLPPFDGHVLCLDDPTITTQPTGNPASRNTAEHLAYVLHTSGSTGRPKGVAVPHRAVLRLVFGLDGVVAMGPRQTHLLHSPIGFDASVFELWGALLQGACCALYGERITSSAGLGQALQRHRVSTLWLTASLFNLIVDEAPQILGGVQQLLTGGEALSPAHVHAAQQQLSGLRLVNGYGPTEATTFTCCHVIPRQALPRASIPIGRPIANTRVHVLDERGQPVPIGVAGELCIAGDGLARGYLNRPEMTAQSFVADPFTAEAGARLYRSGDRVRRLADGNLEFLGRLDDQVKIRGYRIEPGEIEAVLAEHPAVRQAVVLAREDSPGEKRLQAFVVPAEPGRDDVPALRAHLAERLPEHLRPASIVLLATLPLTPHGKVDRSALRSVTRSDADIVDPIDDAPGDDVERRLCEIWQEVLGVACVRIDDNFFELGGHSLLAARLFARLDVAFGRAVSLGALFEAPTVRALAHHYRSATAPSRAGAALVAVHTSGSLPPLFGVAPGDGNILTFSALVHNLGSAQPFYGLQYRGMDGVTEPLESTAQMAAQFVAEVRRVQPDGPYRLLGVCFGAVVAFEMARQLVDAGQQIAFVGLLDPSPPQTDATGEVPRPLPALARRGLAFGSFVAGRLRLYRQQMQALGFRQRAAFLAGRLKLVGEIVGQRDFFRGDRREFNAFRVHESNTRALLRYRPASLGGRARGIEIFATAWHAENTPPAARQRWSALAGAELPYHRVPGENAVDMLKGEHAVAMARLLADRLCHAQRP